MTEDGGMTRGGGEHANYVGSLLRVVLTGASGWALPMPAACRHADQLALVLFEMAVGAR